MENTKEKILLKAIEMFAEKGYKETNLRDLAKELNLSKSAIYRHYNSKEELMEAVINQINLYYKSNLGIKFNINDIKEFKNITLNQIDFTTKDKLIINSRKVVIQEQLTNKEMSKLADMYFVNQPKNTYIEIFNQMIEKKILNNCNTELLATEFISPITLYIHMIDRNPKKKKEIMKKIEEYIDYFIDNHKGVKNENL